MKSLLIATAMLFACTTVKSQLYTKDYTDLYDTSLQNIPSTATYSGHSAVFSSGQMIAASYNYNYLICVNNNGDTVWTRRNCLDSLIGGTYSFKGQTSSVIQLQNGNYVVGGTDNGDAGYLIKQFDSLGNFVSGYFFTDTVPGVYTFPYVKLIACGGNNFYCLYEVDSTFLADTASGRDSTIAYSYVKKLNNVYAELWANSYLHSNHNGVSVTPLPGQGAVDIQNALLTTDGGVAFGEIYDGMADSISSGWVSKQYFRKLNADGSFAWQLDVDATVGEVAGYGTCFPTNDTGVVLVVYGYDSAVVNTVHFIKINEAGMITDSTHLDHDSVMQVANCVALSTGKILLLDDPGNEFSIFDKHLNYLYSMPSPFEPGAMLLSGLVANQYGGAFFPFAAGSPSYPSTWHMGAVNFDSNFHAYPSFVTGTVYQDNNHDCTDNTGDLNIAGAVVTLHDAISGTNYYGYSQAPTGFYSSNVPYGNYAVSHTPTGFEVNECGAYSYNITSDTTIANTNFADTLIPGIRDLQFWVSSMCLVPGYTSDLFIGATNNGSETADTTFVVVLDSRTSFVSSVPAPMLVSGDSITYHINLLSDSFAFFDMQVYVNTSASTGDTLVFTATSQFPDNVVATDDSAVYTKVVTGSFDPNSMSVNQPEYFHRNNTMIYTVEFQNTGTNVARNVVVVDTLDTGMDPSSFRFITANPAVPVISWFSGSHIYFEFIGINLPDSSAAPAGSVGKFTYSIKARSSAMIGDTIFNRASIYFDYNAPVVTNTTMNILGSPASTNSVPNLLQREMIGLFPNPAHTGITIASNDNITKVTINNILGQSVYSREYNGGVHHVLIDVSTLPAGLYFVKVNNADVRKLVKE